MNLRGLFVLSYKTIPIHRGTIRALGIWVYWCDAIQLYILRTWLVKFHVANAGIKESSNQNKLANYWTVIHWSVKTHFQFSGSVWSVQIHENVALVQTRFCTESKNKKEQNPRKTLLILSLRKQDTLTSDFKSVVLKETFAGHGSKNPRRSSTIGFSRIQAFWPWVGLDSP